MSGVRWRIGDLVVLVAILGVGCGLFARGIQPESSPRTQLLTAGFLPMGIAVAVALWRAMIGLRRRGTSGPFTTGFAALGTFATLGVLAWIDDGTLWYFLERAFLLTNYLNPLSGSLDAMSGRFDIIMMMGFMGLAFSLPLMVIALIGGIGNHFLGLVICRRSRAERLHPFTARPTHSANVTSRSTVSSSEVSSR